MPRPLHELLKVASDTLSERDRENAELQAKIAEYERKDLAEEVAQMKIALNVLSHDAFLDEVQTLLASGEDLSQVKTALRHGGARHTSTSGLSIVQGEADKTATTSSDKKAHVARAQQEWEAAQASLSGANPDA